MAAVSVLDAYRAIPNSGICEFYITLANTTDAGDTVDITLADYGITPTGLIAVQGWKHTTDGSVVETENPTTTVTAGVLTITVPAGTNDDFRVYKITGIGIVGDFA